MASNSGKFGLNRYITAQTNLGVFDIDEDTLAKFEVINAGATNIFQIRGRIQGQDAFGLIGTIVGSQQVNFDISLFDFLEITCTTYSSLSTYVEIVGSGFHVSMGDLSPGGDASAFNQSIQIGQLNTIITGQSTLLAELEQKTEPANSQNIRNLLHTQDNVEIRNGGNALKIEADGSINANTSGLTDVELRATPIPVSVSGVSTEAKQDTQITNQLAQDTKLQTISDLLSDIYSDVDLNLLEIQDLNSKIEAENIKQKILKAEDREQVITYADFGTKDQRITQVDYTSPLFSPQVASKVITYTLVVNKYRRDSINWSIA